MYTTERAMMRTTPAGYEDSVRLHLIKISRSAPCLISEEGRNSGLYKIHRDLSCFTRFTRQTRSEWRQDGWSFFNSFNKRGTPIRLHLL